MQILLGNIFDKLKDNSLRIVIFGAGAMGKLLFQFFAEKQIEITAFCDNAVDKMGNYAADNIPIRSLDSLTREYGTKKMVFLISVDDIKSVVEQLEDTGNKNWYGLDQLIDASYFNSMFTYAESRAAGLSWFLQRWIKHYCYRMKKLSLYSLDFVITERCSLRCRECCNLMQYYSAPRDFEIHRLKEELNRVMAMYYSIFELRIIGGEPFMNKVLPDVVRYAAQFPHINSICIYTNGTVMPTEKWLNVLKDYGNVWFSISNYGKLSKNLRPLVKELEKRGIYYQITNDMWISCSSFEKHNRSMDEIKAVYSSCCVRTSVTLLQGKIYPCPFIANGINLKALPSEEGNFVDIMDEDTSSVEKGLRMLHGMNGYSLCDYCKGRPELPEEDNYVFPHEQVDRPLRYNHYK